MAKNVNKWVSFNPDAIGMDKYTKGYLNQHSKFMHASWLIKADYGREVVLDEKVYTIWGLWDVVGTRYQVMLKPIEKGAFRIEDSKTISTALGYTRMRNTVTGEEHKWDFTKNTELVSVSSTIDKKVKTTYEDELTTEEDAYVDPLVKALMDDITDDGDISGQY